MLNYRILYTTVLLLCSLTLFFTKTTEVYGDDSYTDYSVVMSPEDQNYILEPRRIDYGTKQKTDTLKKDLQYITDDASEKTSARSEYQVYEIEEGDAEAYRKRLEKQGSLEQRIAQELIDGGQLLETDPDFDVVVRYLRSRITSKFPDGSSVTSNYIKDQLSWIVPQFEDPRAREAFQAMTHEVSNGAGQIARSITQSASDRFLSSDGTGYSSKQAGIHAKEALLRGGIEAARAVAAASDYKALNNLELEYSLSEGGVDEYSALTVQPLYESDSKQHNVFVQVSYANKDDRDTANAGVAYRYMTDDEQHLYGANLMFDHQWPYHHSRMSVGLDYKTSLIGAHLNHYIPISDWRGRDDGFEEKALGGTDLILSGRTPYLPELEMFVKGFHWDQEETAVLNPDGDDIWGYEFAAEYTPVNLITLRGEIEKDNDVQDYDATVSMRLNYNFNQDLKDLLKKPVYNLDSVVDRRFDKVRRENEIRVQLRQDPNVTAIVTFAQNASVSVGDVIPFGTTITTSNNVGDAATVRFGNGAILDIGQNTQVTIEHDIIRLITGIIQYTSASGGITNLAVPGGTIQLIGTDVDLRVAGSTATLRVRNGAADFTDDTGTTRVSQEELAEAVDGDGLAPQLRGEGTAIFQTHADEAHAQLNLVGPVPTNATSSAFANSTITASGTFEIGETITFSVPITKAVTVTGMPRLRFTLGGNTRYADYSGGTGTDTLQFIYTLDAVDGSLSTFVAQEIEKNGGTLTGSNGMPMVRSMLGTTAGLVISSASIGSSAPTNGATGFARASNIVITFDEPVQAGTGNIVITDLDDGSGTLTIPVTDPQVTIVGNTVTINPTGNLENLTNYEVTYALGVIEDTSGNDTASLDSGSLTFMTADEDPPVLTSTSPTDNSTGILGSTNIVLTFDENVVAGTGNILLTDTVDGTDNRTIPIGDAQVSIVGNTVTINPSSDLEQNLTAYDVTYGVGVIEDTSANDAPALTSGTFNFTTIDTIAPSLNSGTPVDGSTGVAEDVNIVLTFNEPVQAGAGNILITDTDDGSGNLTIPVGDAQVSIVGNTVTINPSSDLEYLTNYEVTYASGVIDDTSGNDAPALMSGDLNFTTVQLCPSGCTQINATQCRCQGTGTGACPSGSEYDCGVFPAWLAGTASRCQIPAGYSFSSGSRSSYRHGSTPSCGFTLTGPLTFDFIITKD